MARIYPVYDELDPSLDDNAREEIQAQDFAEDVAPDGTLDEAGRALPIYDVDAIAQYNDYEAHEELIASYRIHLINRGYGIDEVKFPASEGLFKIVDGEDFVVEYTDKRGVKRDIDLTYEKGKNRYYYARSSLVKATSEPFVRDTLGILKNPVIPAPIENRTSILNQTTPTSRETENIPMQDLGGVVERVSGGVDDLVRLVYDGDHDFTVENSLLRDRMNDIRESRDAYEAAAEQIDVIKHRMKTLEKQIKQLKADRKIAIHNNENVAPLDNRIEELRKKYEAQDKIFKEEFRPAIAAEFGEIRKASNDILYANI